MPKISAMLLICLPPRNQSPVPTTILGVMGLFPPVLQYDCNSSRLTCGQSILTSRLNDLSDMWYLFWNPFVCQSFSRCCFQLILSWFHLTCLSALAVSIISIMKDSLSSSSSKVRRQPWLFNLALWLCKKNNSFAKRTILLQKEQFFCKKNNLTDELLLFLSLLDARCWKKTTLVTVETVLCPAQRACAGCFCCAGHQNCAVNSGPKAFEGNDGGFRTRWLAWLAGLIGWPDWLAWFYSRSAQKNMYNQPIWFSYDLASLACWLKKFWMRASLFFMSCAPVFYEPDLTSIRQKPGLAGTSGSKKMHNQ